MVGNPAAQTNPNISFSILEQAGNAILCEAFGVGTIVSVGNEPAPFAGEFQQPGASCAKPQVSAPVFQDSRHTANSFAWTLPLAKRVVS